MRAFMSDRTARGRYTAAHNASVRGDTYCPEWSDATEREARRILAETEPWLGAHDDDTTARWPRRYNRHGRMHHALAETLRAFVEGD